MHSLHTDGKQVGHLGVHTSGSIPSPTQLRSHTFGCTQTEYMWRRGEASAELTKYHCDVQLLALRMAASVEA